MVTQRIHPMVKISGFLLYLFSLFYFWKATVERIIEVMRIPGVSFFRSLGELPRITRLKVFEFDAYYQPLGHWLVELDYLYFLLLLFIMVFILFLFRFKWFTMPLLLAAVVLPQVVTLLIAIIVFWNRQARY